MKYYILYAGEYVLGYRDGNRSYLNRPVGKRFFIRLRSDNRMVSHDEISKLWEGAIMENHSLYNLIAKMGKVLSVDTRIELVTVGKDGYALKIEDVASCI